MGKAKIIACQPRQEKWVEINETPGGWFGEKSSFQAEAVATWVKALREEGTQLVGGTDKSENWTGVQRAG